MTGKQRRQTAEIAALPSGHVGIHRAGKQWQAYVMEHDLVLLGTYATKRAAVDARAKYWKARDGKPARRHIGF